MSQDLRNAPTTKPAIAEALRDIATPGGSGAAAGASAPAAPAPVDMVTIKVDGREVQVKKGTNVLEACLQNGVDVSYFCYHPGLSSPAVCRQCLVEVVGQPKLVPSCYTPVADKMEVVTNSPRVVQARQQMLEFTLVNHPVDCPICDKAGECTLQKLYDDWDHTSSRTEFDKVRKPKMADIGPHIVLDAERCILCSRCVRVCDEVAGVHQLGMAWRGDREQLTVAPGQRLDNPYSLNTVDVCPVGALTSKDFRFTLRAWELYTVPSVCPGCATGCNVELHHGQGEVWRLVPRENLAVNKYWMCDEGRFTYKEIRSQRQSGARIGSGRGLPAQAVSVEKATGFAAERLSSAVQKGGTIGLVFSAQAENEALFGLSQVAAKLEAAGANIRRYVVGRKSRPERADKILRSADKNPNTRGAQVFAGATAGDANALLSDIGSGAIKALWMVGEDLPVDDAALAELAPKFDALETFVIQAAHDTPLVRRAHAQLPACTWAEVDGSFTNAKSMVQRIRRAVSPAGDARSHLDLVSMIAKKARWVDGEAWQKSPRQAFLQLNAAVQPSDGSAGPFVSADWGRELPPVQLRFANSRG